jgi:hypothetical protein
MNIALVLSTVIAMMDFEHGREVNLARISTWVLLVVVERYLTRVVMSYNRG